MEEMLTEIGSYSLFHEYLNVVGAASPADQEQMGIQAKRSAGRPDQDRSARPRAILYRCPCHIGQL